MGLSGKNVLENDWSEEDSSFDIILISGEFWADHPHSGIGVIYKVLKNEGYKVGVIEKPNWNTTNEFKRLGLPKLFWGITSGPIDSMLMNYTPLKKKRSEDPHKPHESGIPDRATIVYSQKIREAQNELIKEKNIDKSQKVPIILGGIEASLRRFTHFDYWDNSLRKPILLDSKADLLVYGNGEYQIKEIATQLKNGEKIKDLEIPGTCIIKNTVPDDCEFLPSHEEVSGNTLEHKKAFCKMNLAFTNNKCLVEPVNKRFIIQYAQHQYTSEELDALYDLPFSYDIPTKYTDLRMARFSIITHRGCFGGCNFCAITQHQGGKIISRSEESILREIKKMTALPEFKGYIDDLGGPTANMYGMDCPIYLDCKNKTHGKECMNCHRQKHADSHKKLIELLKKSREIEGIKKVFVRSGVRYDLSINSDEYLEELLKYHMSGYLKIAPEHFSKDVLILMNKNNDTFPVFLEKFNEINKSLKEGEKNRLKYYFIAAHPGSTKKSSLELKKTLKKISKDGIHKKDVEKIQVFTPTPMTISTCMYYTGLNPYTLEKIYVPYSYEEKKAQKRILF